MTDSHWRIPAAAVLLALAVWYLWGLGTRTWDAHRDNVPQNIFTSRPTSKIRYSVSIPQKHILTADYLGGYHGTYAFPWSVEARYVNWAKASSTTDSDGQRAAGIKTYVYTDPNRTAPPNDELYTSDETTFAHTCSGSRVTINQYGGTWYLMNTSSANLLRLWINSVPDRTHYDAVFEDDTDDLIGVKATPCNFTPAGWLQASIAETSSFGYPVIYNGAAHNDWYTTPAGTIGMNAAPNVVGGLAEDCFVTTNAPHVISGSDWTHMENIEMQMAEQRKLFFCLGTDYGSASLENQARIYNLASFLLAYDPSTSILMEFMGTPSQFHVEPESQLVPLFPVVLQPSDVSALQIAGGAYGREYSACYYAGALVGQCAVVINPSQSSTYAFPFGSKYGHTLELTGGGVLDGGTAATNGPAPPAQVPALTGIVAFP